MSQDVDISIKTTVENQKDITVLQKEILKLGDASEQVDKKVEELVSGIAKLSEADSLKEKIDDANKSFAESILQYDSAKSALSELEIKMRDYGDSIPVDDQNKLTKSIEKQKKEVERLERQVERSRKSQEKANKELSNASSEIQDLVNNNDEYHRSINELEAAQRSLNSEMEKIKKVGDAYKKLGVRNLEDEIKDLEEAYKTLEESGTLSVDELRQAHEELTSQIEDMRGELDGTADAYSDIKVGALQMVPVVAAFASVSKAAIDYEDKMADVKKVITATDDEFKELNRSLVEMSRTSTVSAVGLAEIAAAGAQLGVEVDNLREFVSVTSDMATAFDMTAEDAGKSVASLSNIFGITINDAKSLGDAVNHLSNNSASNARQIVDVLVRIGGTGKALGLAQEEVAALGATLISFGKSPEIAGTALDAFLTRLQMLDTLGPNGQDSLRKLGISAVEMSQLISNDAAGAITYFLDQVNKLDNNQKSGVLTNIFGRGPQADILLMASNVDQLKKQLDLVGDSYKYLGSMGNESTERAKTTAAQIEILKNNINALSISLGSKLLPVINESLQSIGNYVDAFSAFSDANPQITKHIALLGAALASSKLLTASLQIMATNIATIGTRAITAFSSLSVSSSAAAAALAVANTALKALSFTITKLALPIATVYLLVEAFDALGESMKANIALQKAEKRALEEVQEIRDKKLKLAWEELQSITSGKKAIEEKIKVEKEEAAQIAILNENLEKLGLTYNQIELGLTKSGEIAIDTFSQVGNHAKSTSQIINQSFGAALKEVSTPQEFIALTKSFYNLAEQGKITAADMANYKTQIDELYKSVRLGVITDSEFAEKKKEISAIIAEQVNGFAALNHEISKQIQLINAQIALDKKLLDSTIRKLEAEKEMAKAMNDTVKVQEIERQIQATRIAGMKDEAKAVAKLVEEYKKELLVLQVREANGQALTEAEQQRVRALKAEIEARNNEIEAINKSADAKELDIAMSYKNASALDGLAKSANNAAAAQNNVAGSVAKTGDEAEKTTRKGGAFTPWLRGMADESKKSKKALEDLKDSITELNKALAHDATSGHIWTNTRMRNAQHEALKDKIISQIKKSEALEEEMQKGASMGIDAIDAMQAAVDGLGYVNEEVTKSMTDNLERLRNEAKNTYAEIDRENMDMLNNLIIARNQDESHQLRMRQINERASLESKILEAQEDGDREREDRLKRQMVLLQQVQSQQQRTLRDEKKTQEREKNQKIDINLNGTNLDNLDPNNPEDMRKISEAVVKEITKDKQKSTRFVIKG